MRPSSPQWRCHGRDRRHRLLLSDDSRRPRRPISDAKSMTTDSWRKWKEDLWSRGQPDLPKVRPPRADGKCTRPRQSSCPEWPPPRPAFAKASSPLRTTRYQGLSYLTKPIIIQETRCAVISVGERRWTRRTVGKTFSHKPDDSCTLLILWRRQHHRIAPGGDGP